MKRESVLERLQAIKDGADPAETLEWLMDENGADITREKTVAKSKSDENRELRQQISDLQAQIDEATKKSMTEEELLAKAKTDYENKLADLNTKSNRIEAKKSLTEAGLSIEEAETLLDRFVTPDEKATAETVKALISVFASRKEAVETATKQAMLQSTPKPSADVNPNVSDSGKAFDDAADRGDMVAMAAAIRNGFARNAVTD